MIKHFSFVVYLFHWYIRSMMHELMNFMWISGHGFGAGKNLNDESVSGPNKQYGIGKLIVYSVIRIIFMTCMKWEIIRINGTQIHFCGFKRFSIPKFMLKSSISSDFHCGFVSVAFDYVSIFQIKWMETYVERSIW